MDDLAAANWPLKRPPYLLETSQTGIFAVGDVRGGNVKRIASAVGEGSIAVSFAIGCFDDVTDQAPLFADSPMWE